VREKRVPPFLSLDLMVVVVIPLENACAATVEDKDDEAIGGAGRGGLGSVYSSVHCRACWTQLQTIRSRCPGLVLIIRSIASTKRRERDGKYT
jgi:hypothetical protein